MAEQPHEFANSARFRGKRQRDRHLFGECLSRDCSLRHFQRPERELQRRRDALDRKILSIEIKPGETVELKPGAFHLMFTDLKTRLVKGQSVKGTLTFANAGTVDVEFAVEGMGATAGTASHGMQMDHMQMH
jgi:hypothetical protein